MYTKFLITMLTVLSFMAVAYAKFAEPNIIEPFVNYPLDVTTEVVACDADNNCVAADSVFESYSDNNPVVSTVVKQPVGCDNNSQAGSVHENMTSPDYFFNVPGTLQSTPPPRFAESYGANITYNLPSVEHLAADPNNVFGGSYNQESCDPLALANNIEHFEQQDRENYEQVKTNVVVHDQVPLPAVMEHYDNQPIGDDYDSISSGNGKHDCNKYTIYNRLMYSTSKSNQQSQPCPIRGDLNITSDTHCGGNAWFTSRYHQHNSTHSLGALQHIGQPKQKSHPRDHVVGTSHNVHKTA